MFVVEKGKLEMYLEFDNHEFVIEYLYPGSIINHTVVFMSDPMIVNIRTVEPSVVSYILEEELEQIKLQDKVLDKKISQYQLNLYRKKQKRFPLDIILHANDKKEETINRLKTIMKNVVLNIVLEVKKEKAKPKLKDVLQMFKGMDKEYVANKLRLIYFEPEENGN